MIPSAPFRPHFRTRINDFNLLVLLVVLGSCHALPHTKETPSGVVCDAASWQDVIVFFLLNYVAHAASIRHFPGDSTRTQIWWTVCAMFVPFAGIWRVCQCIAHARPFEKDPLERAKYAGALCMATRVSHEMLFGQGLTEIRGCRIKGKMPTSAIDEYGFVWCAVKMRGGHIGRAVSFNSEKIQGVARLTIGLGYLSIVPPAFKVVPNCRDISRVELPCSNSVLKSAMAVVQVVFACSTLYRTQGYQLATYGYAAFGLTVIPYTIMSLLNLTANLLTPEYPTLFMVQSDVMHHMQHGPDKSEFDGTVGTIVPKDLPPSNSGFLYTIFAREIMSIGDDVYQAKVQIPKYYVGHSEGDLGVEVSEFGRHEIIPTFDKTRRLRNLVAVAIALSALVTPYALIAILTNGFEKGDLSTPIQQGFVVSWLVIGQVFGALSGWLGHANRTSGNMFANFKWSGVRRDFSYFLAVFIVVFLPLLVVITPGLGGFVIVGLMIRQFGSC
jgi:hypothetical protein